MNALGVLKSVNFGKSVAGMGKRSPSNNILLRPTIGKNCAPAKSMSSTAQKESGKSAIYSLMSLHEADFFQENTVLRFAENPRGTTAFSDLKVDPPESEQSFVNLWKLYLLALIGEHFRKFGTCTPDGESVVKTFRRLRPTYFR